jgi:hypothetical protein
MSYRWRGTAFGCGRRTAPGSAAEGADALEVLDGAAVEAFGLGLVTKEDLPIGLAVELAEAGGHQ